MKRNDDRSHQLRENHLPEIRAQTRLVQNCLKITLYDIYTIYIYTQELQLSTVLSIHSLLLSSIAGLAAAALD